VISRATAETVPCPLCRAAPGESCRTISLDKARTPHQDRYLRAQARINSQSRAGAQPPVTVPAVSEEARVLLLQVLATLERGGDFQLGPKGRDRDLPARIRAALNMRRGQDGPDAPPSEEG